MPRHAVEKMQPAYMWVESNRDLKRITTELEREKAIGVDLEADSMFHYREKVCLLQISTRSHNILLDPLKLKDLSPLASLFADSGIRKVFHGSDYDIRSLYRDFGIEVSSLFDTQIAARFLGLRETGLASLLKEKLELQIEKRYQKKDWSTRPLPEAMLSYAVQDTCHLLFLSQILRDELRAKGRLSWVEEECDIQSKVRPPQTNNDPLFLKFRGAGRLDRRTLAVLEAILRLRDSVARRWDRPPFKVLGNTQIMEIAKSKPLAVKDLESIKGLNPKQIKSLGRSLQKNILEVMELPEGELPIYPRKIGQRIGYRVAERVKALKQWREQCAANLEIDPALVFNNHQIKSLALATPRRTGELKEINGIRNWQRKAFGRDICRLLKTMP